MPSGKQNSFASNCEPCGILVEIKQLRRPTSYANAFAEPVERIGKPDDDAADEKSSKAEASPVWLTMLTLYVRLTASILICSGTAPSCGDSLFSIGSDQLMGRKKPPST